MRLGDKMETYRSIQLDMLCELDQLCRANDIPYILSGYTARAAVRDHTLPTKAVMPTIAMRYCDAVRLAKVCASRDRTVEHSVSNRRISRMVMRYARPDTTCIKVDEWKSFRHPGIGVDIELIRPVPGKGAINKLWKLLEAWASMAANFRCLSAGWCALLAVFAPLEKLALRIAYTGWPFGESGRLRIARFPKKSVEFSASLLDDRNEIEVEGKKFFVSREIERYLNLEFEESGAQEDPERMLDDLALMVIDPEMPCAQTLELVRGLYGKGPKVNWVHRCILRGRMRFLRRKIQRYWDILFCTRDRFALWKQLMPDKKTICEQFRQGEETLVRAAMKPYLTALDRNLSKGLALCFDKELFEIALSLLKADGRDDDARRLQTLVFPEHLKPLKIEGFEYD